MSVKSRTIRAFSEKWNTRGTRRPLNSPLETVLLTPEPSLTHYRARMDPLLIASAARVASLKAYWLRFFTALPPLCQARAAIGVDPIRAEQGSLSTCPQR